MLRQAEDGLVEVLSLLREAAEAAEATVMPSDDALAGDWSLHGMPTIGVACDRCGMPAICFIVHPDETRHPDCGRIHVGRQASPPGSMVEFPK